MKPSGQYHATAALLPMMCMGLSNQKSLSRLGGKVKILLGSWTLSAVFVFWTEHGVSEFGSASILRWKSVEVPTQIERDNRHQYPLTESNPVYSIQLSNFTGSQLAILISVILLWISQVSYRVLYKQTRISSIEPYKNTLFPRNVTPVGAYEQWCQDSIRNSF
jgi:hypothetical protein